MPKPKSELVILTQKPSVASQGAWDETTEGPPGPYTDTLVFL